jgi:general secretion pathway protein J
MIVPTNHRAGDRLHEGGFTLLEILLAIAILGLMTAMVSLSLSGTFRLRDVMQDNGGRDHMARASLAILTDELTLGRTLRGAPWIGRNGDADGRPADMLSFVTAGHLRSRPDARESDIGRILYARQGASLVRYALPNPYVTDLQRVEQTELATGVTALNFRYYDARLATWLDEWDGVKKNGLPAAILIELTLEDARKEAVTYTQWIPIPRQLA